MAPPMEGFLGGGPLGADWLLSAGMSGLLQRAGGFRMDTTLDQLLAGLPARVVRGPAKVAVGGLTADSRRTGPGMLFFALPGTRVDGSNFIEEAVGRGAAAVVVPRGVGACGRATVVETDDIRGVLGVVARRFYGHPEQKLTLLGVTGTNGKTTTGYLARHFLEAGGAPVGMIGTVAYHLGRRTLPAHRTTPDALDLAALFAQMVEAGCRSAVMEVSSHSLEQRRVDGLPYTAAAFTNLTQDHLDYHQTMEAYYAAKRKLFDGSVGRAPGRAVVNLDDSWGRRLAEEARTHSPVWTYSMRGPADLRARDVQLSAAGAEFVLEFEGRAAVLRTALLGHYNVQNVLAAAGLALAAGARFEDLPARLATFPGVPGRMERIDRGQPFVVAVDYAHTDDALRNALAMLRPLTAGRLLCVFGCGGNRDRAKRPKMTRAVLECADLAWATADNPRREPLGQIFDDMRAGVDDPARVVWVEDRRRAVSLALDACRPGDCLLIAGKGHETFQEFADTVVPFDDRAVAAELLSLKGWGSAAPGKEAGT